VWLFLYKFLRTNGRDSATIGTQPESFHYTPTAGCRIIHFNTRQDGIPIECWDASGDIQYERCWSAFAQGNDVYFRNGDNASEDLTLRGNVNSRQSVTDAIIFIYNPENPNHVSEIQKWLERFAVGTKNLSVSSTAKPPSKYKFRPYCMLLQHKMISSSEPRSTSKTEDPWTDLPQSLLERCSAIHQTEASNLENVQNKFDNFLKMVYNASL
jgi:hypothetical protein